ncbi:MAG: Fur family transcriptional regulator [Dehalococcoidia bacterium]
MPKYEEVLDALRAVGYRLTPQRVMILSAIASSPGHMTAEEIHEKVKKTYPYIDIATVYRTLQLLRRLRLVVEIDLGSGSSQYELAKAEKHHHMVCRECQRTIDIDHRKFLEPVRTALLGEFGFEADIDHFAIFGLCRDCRAKKDRG